MRRGQQPPTDDIDRVERWVNTYFDHRLDTKTADMKDQIRDLNVRVDSLEARRRDDETYHQNLMNDMLALRPECV